MNRTFSLRRSPRKLGIYLLITAALAAHAPAAAQVLAKPSRDNHPLHKLVDESPVFSRIFTGFALYDPDADQYLYEKDAGKYYTPASNTKLLTLYAALRVLGDSLPTLRYIVSGDSLVFWGTGNPLFLHPDMPADTTVLAFLRRWPGKLFFSPHNYEDERFGAGWSWADYQYTYQAEKSPFPIYANVASFRRGRLSSGFDVTPGYFRRLVVFNPDLPNDYPDVRRREDSNLFEYNAAAMTGVPFARSRPFRYSPELVANLLADTLHRSVAVLDLKRLPPRNAFTLSIPVPDTLYRRLMQDSDNFFAEQLMLLVSDKLFGVQQTKRAIDYAQANLLRDLPDKLEWADGSGLSRYNLFTPRSIVALLHKIYHTLPREQLFRILPAGGVSGTIRDLYAGPRGQPFVFAKTGTLSNKHCLSGYIVTKRGKLLLFSFMHNNYINGTSEVKAEMDKVLRWIYDQY